MTETLEEDVIHVEFVMLLLVGALGGVCLVITMMRACSARRGYRSNINSMRDDMEYSFDPKAYYFDPNDLENIEMI